MCLMTFKQSWVVEKKIKAANHEENNIHSHMLHPIIQRKHFQVLIGWQRTQEPTITTTTKSRLFDQTPLVIISDEVRPRLSCDTHSPTNLNQNDHLRSCFLCDLVWNAKAVKPNKCGIYKKKEFYLNSNPFVTAISVVGPIIRWFWRPFCKDFCCF